MRCVDSASRMSAEARVGAAVELARAETCDLFDLPNRDAGRCDEARTRARVEQERGKRHPMRGVARAS